MKTPKTKKKDAPKDEPKEVLVEVEGEKVNPIEIIAKYVSDDKNLKAVVKVNRLTSAHEVEFYKDGKKIATESYAFHTRRYHEDAAENYVKGIKKI